MDRPRTIGSSPAGHTGHSDFVIRWEGAIAIHVPTGTPRTCVEPADRR
jgi:hypothetical protein